MQQLDIEAIGDYAVGYAAKLCAEYFPKGYRLNGEDIVSACEIRQVNMLIVKNIFIDWKQHTEALKNSYFDYSHPEVKKILEQLSYELSKHILMPVQDFELYLARAVKETLYYCLDPGSYLFELIEVFSHDDAIETSEVFAILKYLSFHPSLIQAITSDVTACGTMIFVRDLIDIISDRCSDQSLLEDNRLVLNEFKAYFDFEIKNWWLSESAYFSPIGQDQEIEDQQDDQIDFETLDSESEPVLHLGSQLPPIETNSDQFADSLFGGNRADYQEAMLKVSQFSSYSEAVSFLRNTYARKYNWQSGVILSNFLDEIDSRF